MLTIFKPVEIEAISDNNYHQKVLRQVRQAGANIELGQNGVLKITYKHETEPVYCRVDGLPWLGSNSFGVRNK